MVNNLKEINFLETLHGSTKRNYLERVVDIDRAECAKIIKQWGADYWDGSRHHGYGGYVYDGRWRKVAERMAEHYGLTSEMRILDVGCGRAHLLYEFTQVLLGIEVAGIDISEFGIETAKDEVRPFLKTGTCTSLPWPEDNFDFVFSLNLHHNLEIFDLWNSIREIERVGRSDKKYVCVESWRSEEEKANMLYWAIPCESFHSPEGWKWLLSKAGYHGDIGFIFFE